jgi:predicted outer membrane repeat protein
MPRDIALRLIVPLLAWATCVHADDAVVGNGTAASCTELALDDALFLVHFGATEGGTIRFDCGPDPVSIPLTTEKLITVNTVIDGGNRIDLDANDLTRHFNLFAGRTELRDLVLLGGRVGSGAYGGAVYLHNGAELVVRDCSFLGNEGGSGGGAIAGEAGSLLSVHDSVFDANSATSGGAISKTGQLLVQGGQFLSNVATDQGGALQWYATTGSIAGTTFVGNTAASGGAILLRGGDTRIDDARLEANTASASGGGLYADEAARVELRRAVIVNNQAGNGGGGLHLQGVQDTAIDPENILPSTASTSALVIDSTLASNRAYGGGAAFVFGPLFQGRFAVLEFQGTEIRDNVARRHGGGVASFGRLIVRNSRVTGNVANGQTDFAGDGDGGGIHTSHFANSPELQTLVIETLVRGNIARDEGGGIDVFGHPLILRDTTLTENVARYGGGLSVFALEPVTLERAAFVRNRAQGGGGLYLFQRAPAQLSFLTFADNQLNTGHFYGRDILMKSDSDNAGNRFEVSLRHVTAINTLALPGSSLFASDQKGFRLRNSIVFGGDVDCEGSPTISEGGNLLRGASCGTTAADLQPSSIATLGLGPLVELPFRSYYLPAATSPAVDFPLCIAGTTVDQRGEALNRDGDGDGLLRCDVGAIERQSVNEPPPTSNGALLRDGFESP